MVVIRGETRGRDKRASNPEWAVAVHGAERVYA